MQIFCKGMSGYIAGSVAAAMVAEVHHVSRLVRSQISAGHVKAFGIDRVHGTLDDINTLRIAAARSDAVINAASADH